MHKVPDAESLACHHAPPSDNAAAQIANEKDGGDKHENQTDFFVIISTNKVELLGKKVLISRH